MKLEDAIYHIKEDNSRVFRNGEIEVFSDNNTVRFRNIRTFDIGATIHIRYLNDEWKETKGKIK